MLSLINNDYTRVPPFAKFAIKINDMYIFREKIFITRLYRPSDLNY